MGIKVVVWWENAGTEEFFLKDGDEVEEVLGMAVAYVIDSIGNSLSPALPSREGSRSNLHDADNAFDDVVDVGKVALAVTIVEDLDGLTFHEFVSKTEVGHVGTTGWAIDGEETETSGGDIVEFRVGVGEQFVRLLRGSIEADGVIDLVVGAVGHFLVGAIDAAAGGIDEVLDGMVPAGFEDVVEADEVAFNILSLSLCMVLGSVLNSFFYM